MNSDSIHKSLLEKFKANNNGSSLEYYIKKTAWEEDSNHITKIYLVKDCETNDIVFFFGLKTGILYFFINYFVLIFGNIFRSQFLYHIVFIWKITDYLFEIFLGVLIGNN